MKGQALKVVLADPIDAEAVQRLSAAGLRVHDVSASPDELPSAIADAWALIVRSRTKVTSALLVRAKEISVVARAGVGVDNIDVSACTARHVRVVNAPTAATASVAELTVGLMIALARNLFPQVVSTKAGGWVRGHNTRELTGKTVGFVGYGRIAREVRARLRPFEVRSLAFDPYITETKDGTELLPLDDLLAASDFVSLHAALTPENHHLVNAERLSRMPPTAYLLNLARGGLVDEEALEVALSTGRLAGAALDVFETEPPARRALLALPNVIPTPHIGAATVEGQRRAGQQVVDELLRAQRGEPLQALVNPEPPT